MPDKKKSKRTGFDGLVRELLDAVDVATAPAQFSRNVARKELKRGNAKYAGKWYANALMDLAKSAPWVARFAGDVLKRRGR